MRKRFVSDIRSRVGDVLLVVGVAALAVGLCVVGFGVSDFKEFPINPAAPEGNAEIKIDADEPSLESQSPTARDISTAAPRHMRAVSRSPVSALPVGSPASNRDAREFLMQMATARWSLARAQWSNDSGYSSVEANRLVAMTDEAPEGNSRGSSQSRQSSHDRDLKARGDNIGIRSTPSADR